MLVKAEMSVYIRITQKCSKTLYILPLLIDIIILKRYPVSILVCCFEQEQALMQKN